MTFERPPQPASMTTSNLGAEPRAGAPASMTSKAGGGRSGSLQRQIERNRDAGSSDGPLGAAAEDEALSGGELEQTPLLTELEPKRTDAAFA